MAAVLNEVGKSKVSKKIEEVFENESEEVEDESAVVKKKRKRKKKKAQTNGK